MQIPELNYLRSRSREYDSYSKEERSQIVYGWMFSSHQGHRDLDRDVLGLNPEKFRGFQSMSVLHYLGLKKVPFFQDLILRLFCN